jgi:BirA family biotin operon repressor/biotin-[acetyl-CoA-carboxylase] ligase
MFSLGLPLAPRDWSGLSLAVGLAVAEALHPAIGLKWPNDLWLAGPQAGRHPDRDRRRPRAGHAPGGDRRGLNIAPRPGEG